MAKENPNNVENKAEIPPVQIQAAGSGATPSGVATIAALDADEAAKLIEELKAQITNKDTELAEQASQLTVGVEKIAALVAEVEELKAHPRNAPIGNAVRSFVVVKEYCGVGEGEIVTSNDAATIAHMVKNGHWEER